MFCPYKCRLFLYDPSSPYPDFLFRQYPPVNVKSKDISYENKHIEVDLRIPVIHGSYKKQYIDNINNSVESDITEFKDQVETGAVYDAEKLESQGKKMQPYQASNIYEVGYNRNGIISIEILYNVLLNKLSNYVKTGYTYDLSTGRSMSLGDLFKPGSNYIQVLNNEIRRQLAEKSTNYLPATAAHFTGISPYQPFYLEDSNLVIFFGFNEVAPVSADIPIINVPLSKLRNILNPRILS